MTASAGHPNGRPTESSAGPSQTSAFDLLTEARWEQEGVRRAQKRYEEAAAARDPSTLPSGQKLLRAVVPPLARAIAILQVEARAITVAAVGRQARWALPILLLDPQPLALMTVATALNADRGTEADGLTSLAKTLGRAVRDEVEYRRWVAVQVKANKEAKKAQDWEHKDLLAEMKRLYPAIDGRSWRRWKRRLEGLEVETWPEEVLVQVGAALLQILAQTVPDRFSIETREVSGRTQLFVRLSPEALAVMRDVEERAAVSRPALMPMVIPPIPWRYTNPAYQAPSPGGGHRSPPLGETAPTTRNRRQGDRRHG